MQKGQLLAALIALLVVAALFGGSFFSFHGYMHGVADCTQCQPYQKGGDRYKAADFWLWVELIVFVLALLLACGATYLLMRKPSADIAALQAGLPPDLTQVTPA